MKKKTACIMMTMVIAAALLGGCGSSRDAAENAGTDNASPEVPMTETAGSETETEAKTESEVKAVEEPEMDGEIWESATVTVFAAKSLNTVMEELIAEYNRSQPNVTIQGNYDSSGTLMTQIEEGAACDVFFSAAQKQMNQLQEDGLVVEGTRHNVVNNQVCVVTYAGSGTTVTGLTDMGNATSIALADGSVPVGRYTRQAMINAGMLEAADEAASVTTVEISAALDGVEINECANVGAVTAAVAEHSNEVGTVYYSDTYGLEDQLEILEVVPYDLTGDVIYPVAQIVNAEADELESQAAADFVAFLISDVAKDIYQKYYFDTDVEP